MSATDPQPEPLSKNALKKLEKQKQKLEKKVAKLSVSESDGANQKAPVEDYSKDTHYGQLPINQSQTQTGLTFFPISKIDSIQEDVWIRARVQTTRIQGKKLCFLNLRQGYSTIQAVVAQNKDTISSEMVRWCAGLSSESIVHVFASIKQSPEPIKSATVTDFELKVQKLFVSSVTPEQLAFKVEDAARNESETVSTNDDESPATYANITFDTRLNNRVLDLRTITNHAIFELNHGICSLFRTYLTENNFMEVHTPKMISSASEGGSNVFKIQYFKTEGYLAQSPQLYKQMMIAADFERVFEIGPVFRAEDSNTYRHLTEFTGVDLELALQEHYHEAMYLIGDMFQYIFENLEKKYSRQIEIIRRQFPSAPLLLPSDKKLFRLTFKEAVDLLKEAGWRNQRTEEHSFSSVEEDAKYVFDPLYDDFNTREEKKLGSLIHDKFKTDFYVIDKFPLAVRAFYTMPDPQNPPYSNSYDFFIRGEEILSGAQRIHDYDLLLERIKTLGIPFSGLEDYAEAFRLGAPPHAGGGIGLERVLMYYLGLSNVRYASAFPRDPRRLSP